MHLAEDSKNLGTLDSFSAFKFENRLGYLSSILKGKNRLLEQVYNRLSERRDIINNCDEHNKSSFKIHFNSDSAKVINFKGFQLKLTRGNNCFIDKNRDFFKAIKFVQVDEIIEIHATKLKKVDSVYTHPENSEIFGIYSVTLTDESSIISVYSVLNKIVLLQSDDSRTFYAFPLLHRD